MMILTASLVSLWQKKQKIKKNKKMNKIVANTYVPTYQEDYNQLPWYERDMKSYIDHVKYKTIRDDPDQ